MGMDLFCIQLTFNGTFGSDHTDFSIFSHFCSFLCSCFDHTKNRDVKFRLHGLQCQRTGGITGDHDCLYPFALKETDDLSGKTDDRLLRFASIGNAGGIAKINDALLWYLTHDFTRHGQSTHTGVKNADGCISKILIFCHFSILPVYKNIFLFFVNR